MFEAERKDAFRVRALIVGRDGETPDLKTGSLCAAVIDHGS